MTLIKYYSFFNDMYINNISLFSEFLNEFNNNLNFDQNKLSEYIRSVKSSKLKIFWFYYDQRKKNKERIAHFVDLCKLFYPIENELITAFEKCLLKIL